ncbi:MAG: Short-chain dehydrogenase/reductase [Pedosphaera sp.]|nr:Short-chain dehydrogenase/reductase [Pedosphaera sp.]
MPRNISDSVIVITGASSGIGRATALEVAKQQGTVILASRQEEALRDLAEVCEEMGGRALAVRTDVTDEKQVQELARRTVETFGRIDAWVNNAAVTLYSKFEDAPPDAFRRVIETNLFGCIHGSRAALPYFRHQGHGVLVNISSVFSKVGAPYVTAYTASKFAITGFSESLRTELRNEPDIHVCTILPATIDTPIFQHAANYTGRFLQALPPVYQPGQVAEAILNCITNPQREVMVGRAAKQMVLLRKLSTPLAERFVARKVERQHFLDKPSNPSPGNVFEPMSEYNTVNGGWTETDHKGRKVLATIATLLLAGAGVGYYAYRKQKRSPLARARRKLEEAIA